MAARAMMEQDNMLRLSRLRDFFNPALPPGRKLWNDLAEDFARLDRRRLSGYRRAEYARLSGAEKDHAAGRISAAVLKRMGETVKRRHDIVHNCDRPRSAIQSLSLAATSKALADIEAFVGTLDDHLDAHRLF